MHRFDRKQLTSSESESRMSMNLVSSRLKHNQFHREAKLTCLLYRRKEDMYIRIYVFKRVFNVWNMLKNVSMQQHFEQFVGK